MNEIYRPLVPIGVCCSLVEAGARLGGSKSLLHNHKGYGTEGFPNPVARIGQSTLYVFTELEAFYNSVLWRQGDRHINELKGA